MRSIWMKLSLALALLGAVPPALAAGFDCAKANGAAEQKICADPGLSALDSQMTQVFEQTRAQAGSRADALVRDQHNWLRERDEAMASGYPAPYQDRIKYLQHVFDAPPTDTPLLAAIVKHLANRSSVALLQRYSDMNQVMGGDGSVFKMATEQMFDPTKPQPFDIGPLVKVADQMAGQDGVDVEDMRLSRLDDLHFGALYLWTGTARCMDVVFFGWHDRAIKFINAPEVFDHDCGMSGGPLVEFQGHAYAMQLDDLSVVSTDIMVQQWNGGGWSSFNRVHVRYDYSTLPQHMRCALTDCSGLTAQVSKVFVRYLQNFDASGLVGHVPADVQAQFEAERKLALKDIGVWNLPWGNTPKRFYYGMDGFDGASVFFPVHWQGEWLLGRIGHASMGWHTSDDWLLGIWRRDGHTYAPVLGMVAEAQRTSFLLATWDHPYAN
ncbi:lysozyme inhibitor LprI family protein [Rhodanobacter hydrolyticus]|uniref:DUF1311 domain-containing protein n=1 Tax=Rhodanobacter hydrolyticus TaxID=2250595 RepID=A0ABW8J5H8_9GAMM